MITILVLFAACTKEHSCENCRGNGNSQAPAVLPQPNSHPPVANAGKDSTIFLPANKALLDGSASYDPDINIAHYSWAKIAGPSSLNMVNNHAVSCTISGLTEGAYTFELTVTDSTGLSSRDTVLIRVEDISCDVSSRLFTNAKLNPLGMLSQKREAMSVGTAADKIVFAGGFIANGAVNSVVSTVDIYDTRNKSWSTASLSVPRYDMAVATAGGKIYFAGGYNGDEISPVTYNTVDIYDAVNNGWSIIKMPASAGGRAAAVVNDKIFFAGGYSGNGLPQKTENVAGIDCYNVRIGSWSTKTVSSGRYGMAAAVANNKAYFAGGELSSTASSDEIDMYDGNTDSWSQTTLSQPASHMAAISLGDEVYFAGGQSDQGFKNLNRIEIINARNNTRTADCLFQRNDFFSAVATPNYLVFFIGNSSLTGAKNKFDIYNIAGKSWSIGLLFDGIQGASIISVNNTIYVAGGYVLGNLTNQLWELKF